MEILGSDIWDKFEDLLPTFDVLLPPVDFLFQDFDFPLNDEKCVKQNEAIFTLYAQLAASLQIDITLIFDDFQILCFSAVVVST